MRALQRSDFCASRSAPNNNVEAEAAAAFRLRQVIQPLYATRRVTVPILSFEHDGFVGTSRCVLLGQKVVQTTALRCPRRVRLLLEGADCCRWLKEASVITYEALHHHSVLLRFWRK